MRRRHRIEGANARTFLNRSVQGIAVASMLGLAPLAASSGAAPDASAARIDAATSAAVIELVPVAFTTDVTVPASAFEQPVDQSSPSAPQETVLGRGVASYYAAKFNGRRTASGERFDNTDMTAAHRTLPFGSLVRVTNAANGRSVVVRINDRGPFSHGRMIDVSRAAAAELGLIASGHGQVEIALIED